MTHRGKPEKIRDHQIFRKQRILALKYIADRSYQDYLQAETVSRTDHSDVHDYLLTVSVADEPLHVGAIPQVEKGLVLSNGRGTGAWQT